MRVWKLLDFVCALLSLPMLGCLGVLTWVGFLGAPGRFALPAALLLLGTAGLFIALQTISNDMQDAEIRKQRGGRAPHPNRPPGGTDDFRS